MSFLQAGLPILDALMGVLNPGLDRHAFGLVILGKVVPHARRQRFAGVSLTLEENERCPAVFALFYCMRVHEKFTHLMESVFGHLPLLSGKPALYTERKTLSLRKFDTRGAKSGTF